MDPNNPDNDISGGSKEIRLVFKCFAEAYRILKSNFASIAFGNNNIRSLLSSIIGGNYESYRDQRQRLNDIFENDPRFEPYRPPPPPSSPPPEPSAVPPPPPEELDTKYNSSSTDMGQEPKFGKKKQGSLERANRFRALRPDLKRVPKFLSTTAAIKLGGYSNQSELDRDLNKRETSLNTPATN